MSPMSSRRRPWPWDVLLGVGAASEGLLLAPDPTGVALMGKKVQSLAQVVPDRSEYGNEDVYRERSALFGPVTLGVGERVQSTVDERRARYAINAQFSGRLRGKGPLWHGITPPASGEIRDFPEALHGGVNTQFVLAGRYVLRRTDDTGAGQVTSRDMGASRQCQSGVRWKHSGTSPGAPVDGLFVALDNAELWRYDGASWLQMGTSTTIPAQYLETIGDELWRGWSLTTGAEPGSYVSKCVADPTQAVNWSGAIRVGDGSATITGIRQLNNRLFVFKSNGGVYTLNTDGSDNDLLPDLRSTITATNGQNPAAWLGSLWFRQGDSLWRLEAQDGATVQQVGPERLLENDAEIAGAVTCFAGFEAWYAHLGVYNSQNGNSYLWRYGDWLPPSTTGEGRYAFADVLQGALVKWEAKRITTLRVSRLQAGNPRLYAGFADGTMGWLLLPRNTPNPFSPTSGCEYSLDTSQVVWPVHTMLAPADYKAFLSVAGFGPTLDGTNTVQVAYRTDPSLPWTDLPGRQTGPGQRVNFPDNSAAKQLEVRETFLSPTSATTPVVERLILREALRPSLRIEYAGTFKARHRQARHDGASDRKAPEQIRALLRAAADAPGSVVMTIPDETVHGFSWINFGESLPARSRRYGLAWDIPASFVVYSTADTYGTVDRLGGMTVDDLGSLTVDQLGVL